MRRFNGVFYQKEKGRHKAPPNLKYEIDM